MGLQLWVGYVAFFAVPAAIWLIAAAVAKKKGVDAFLSFIAGTDGRLSISRAQALAWTFVIFGAFAAAMAVKTPMPVTNAQPEQPGDWVKIPAELLQLAGIAIGSGVLSGLIAAVQDGGERAVVDDAKIRAKPDVKSAGPSTLEIMGQNLGTGGTVTFAGEVASIREWSPNRIAVELFSQPKTGLLKVDSPNGKLCYHLTGEPPNIEKGESVTCYELSDLFREDKSPNSLSLMKFQMFGWTLIAIVLYIFLFLSKLDANITDLPTIDSTVVVLTGISLGGYLAQKGVSGMKPQSKGIA